MGAAATAVMGRRIELTRDIVERFPDLTQVEWRRGGLLPRIAAFPLGESTVSAVTLWGTVWLSEDAPLSDELLLHELRHVHQFQSGIAFPFQYLWEFLRHGYEANRFEVDARAYAAARLRDIRR